MPDGVKAYDIGVDQVRYLIGRDDDSWKRSQFITQSFGDVWLKHKRSVLAKVRSAIMPDTCNFLLNPEHPDVEKIKVVSITVVHFDPRLLPISLD